MLRYRDPTGRELFVATTSSVLSPTCATYCRLPSGKLRQVAPKRLPVRESFRCQACGNGSISLEIHHLHYVSADPWESADDDLECLCSDCHGWRRHWDALFPDLRDMPTLTVRRLLPLITKALAQMGSIAAAQVAIAGLPAPTPEEVARTDEARARILAELEACN
jgi:hypothetical protein